MDLRLLFLMLLSCGVNGKDSSIHFLNHCDFMVVESKVFQRWCIGSYPSAAKTRYQDKLITVGEPYALYLPRSQDSIMVLHRQSPFLDCRNLVYKDEKTFYCLDRDLNRTLTVDNARVHCLIFHMRLPDDLMNECLKQSDFHNENRYPIEVLRTRRCILHYTLGEKGAQSLPQPMLLVFLTLLLQMC